MRGKTLRPPGGQRSIRLASVGVVVVTVVTAVALSACSAVNITGFDFPVFGLTKKAETEAPETTGAIGEPPPQAYPATPR